jgi:hypothetical protein
MQRVNVILVCVVLGTLALGAGNAAAASPLSDCSHHNKLIGHYTVAELNHALATMPSDIREYTACYSIIQNQLYAQLGKL